MYIAMFHYVFCKPLVRVIWVCFYSHLYDYTWAKDFKFTGAIVQKLYLVMVALTQNWLSAYYAWFFHGGSHLKLTALPESLHV